MTVYGSFTYGSGVVYGTESTVRVVFVARNLLRVEMIAEVIVDDALNTASNYTIQSVDGSEEIGVRSVIPFLDGRTTTNYFELMTDRHTVGQRYTIQVGNLTARGGAAIGTITSEPRTHTPTKVDSLLASIPSFLDRRPGAVLGSILNAIGLEDERIGGAVRERIRANS